MSFTIETITETNCRICFIECSVAATNASDIAELFHELIGYKVIQSDIPQKICRKCFETLTIVKLFKETCDKSERCLEQLRQEKVISVKQEETIFVQEVHYDVEIKNEEEEDEVMPGNSECKKKAQQESPTKEINEPYSRKYKERERPTTRRWKYVNLEEHLRKNRIEPSPSNLFVLDFELTRPENLPPNLDVEEKIDSDQRILACSYCSFKVTGTAARQEIKKHCETTCKRMMFRCTCSFELYSLDLLRQHITKKHPNKRVMYRELECNFCQFTCCYESTMEKHCKKMHAMEVVELERCVGCEEVFYCDDIKLQHIVFRCNDGDTTLAIPFKTILGKDLTEPCYENSSKKTRPLNTMKICELCGKNFSRHLLKTHIERDHQKIRYECDLCGRNYNLKLNLQKHMQLHHLGFNKYPCNFCEKTFNNYNTRYMHVRTHHSSNPKPYSCDLCEKRFIKPYAMRNHRATHSGN